MLEVDADADELVFDELVVLDVEAVVDEVVSSVSAPSLSLDPPHEAASRATALTTATRRRLA